MKNFLYNVIDFSKKHINIYYIAGGIASILSLLFNVILMVNYKTFNLGLLLNPILYIAIFAIILFTTFNKDEVKLKLFLLIFYCYFFINAFFSLGQVLEFGAGALYGISTVFIFISLLAIILVGVLVVIQKIKEARLYGLIINWAMVVSVCACALSVLLTLISGFFEIYFWYALSIIATTVISTVFVLIFLAKYNEK